MVTQTLPDDEVVASFVRAKFPRNSLNDVLKLVKVVQDLGHGVAVRRVSVFKEIGRSPDSGPSSTLVASASRGYGLLQVMHQGTYLEPTAEGTALVLADTDAAKLARAWQVMSSNEYFQAFISRWANKTLPSDEAIIDVLKQSSGFRESDSKACFTVFMENLTDYGLIEQVGGKRVITPPDHLPDAADIPNEPDAADPRVGALAKVDSNSISPPTALEGTAQQMVANLTGQIQPQIAFNIQIQLPGDASPETYEAIFKNISVHLLGRSED